MSKRSRRAPRKLNAGSERVYEHGRVVRMIAQVDAARMLHQGKAVKVVRSGVFMGIEIGGHAAMAKERDASKNDMKQVTRSVLEDADARRSCVVLSRAEVESIADRSKSRTEGLTDAQRDSRVQRGFPEMDLPERARAKFNQMFGHLVTA